MCCPIAAPIKLFSTLQTNNRYSIFVPKVFVTVTLINDSWLKFLHFNENHGYFALYSVDCTLRKAC